jgi:hypothetical protein
LSSIHTHEQPDYPFSGGETAGQPLRLSAQLAAALGLHQDNNADNADVSVDLGLYRVPATWAEYDEMLALHDADPARYPEPEGPHADLSHEIDSMYVDNSNQIGASDAPSDRTMRRRRGMRRSEVNALLARDGRRTAKTAIARVSSRRNADDDRWVMVCEFCAHPFDAVRVDARFCSDRCRKASTRRMSR